jgi:hypothetical protein
MGGHHSAECGMAKGKGWVDILLSLCLKCLYKLRHCKKADSFGTFLERKVQNTI